MRVFVCSQSIAHKFPITVIPVLAASARANSTAWVFVLKSQIHSTLFLDLVLALRRKRSSIQRSSSLPHARVYVFNMHTATIAYRVELLPTQTQKLFFRKQLVARRRVWNYLLTRSQQRLAAGNEFQKNELNRELTVLKKTPKYNWLYDVPSPCTHSAAQEIEKTFQAAKKQKTAGKPKYKYRKSSDSFQIVWNRFSRSFKSVQIQRCPGEYVRIKKHDKFHGILNHNHARIIYDHGKWFLTFTATVPLEKLQLKRNLQILDAGTRNEVVGIDLGLNHFAIVKTDADAYKIDNPRFYRKAEDKLAALQRKRSSKEKYSKRYRRLSKSIAKLHRHTKNQRKQFHHDTANQILASSKVVVAETLNVRGMVRNHCLAKSISDAGWSQFRGILKYKASWYDSEYEETNQYFASSKCCSTPGCDYKADKLPLKIREWTCPKCNTVHDRDINAATNIRSTRVDDPRNARVKRTKVPKTIGSWSKHHANRAADTSTDKVPMTVLEMAGSGNTSYVKEAFVPTTDDSGLQSIKNAELKALFPEAGLLGRASLQ